MLEPRTASNKAFKPFLWANIGLNNTFPPQLIMGYWHSCSFIAQPMEQKYNFSTKKAFINFLCSSSHHSPILLTYSIRTEQVFSRCLEPGMCAHSSLTLPPQSRHWEEMFSGYLITFFLFLNGRIIFLFAYAGSFLGGFAALFLGEHPMSSAVFGKGGSRRTVGLQLMTLAAAAHLACRP